MLEPLAELKSLLFSAHTFVDLWARLIFAFGALALVGMLVFPRLDLRVAERVFVGVLLSHYAVLGVSAATHGLATRATPPLLWALAVVGAGIRYRIGFRHNDTLWQRWTVKDILFFLVLALLYASGDWPRFQPMSFDSSQHTFFLHQLLRYNVIPGAQPPLGPEPFHYPGALSTWGYVWAIFSFGLTASDVTPLMASLSVFLCITLLWGLNRSRLIAYATSLGFLGLNWGIYYPYKWHQGLGRVVALPLVTYLVARVFAVCENESYFYLFLLVLAGPFLAALNPSLAPLFVVILASLMGVLIARHKKVFAANTQIIGLGKVSALISTASCVLALEIFGDVYFKNLLWGIPPWEPKTTHFTHTSWRWSPLYGFTASLSALVHSPIDFFNSLLGKSMTGALPLLAYATLLGFWAQTLISKTLFKRFFLFIVAGLLALSTFIYGFEFTGGLQTYMLMPRYTAHFVDFLCWALLLISLGRVLAQSFETIPWQDRRGFSKKFWIVSTLLWAVAPISSLGALAGRTFYRFEKPSELEARELVKLAHFWHDRPNEKVLLENENADFGGETWLVPVNRSVIAALLPNSNPAFFYFQGSRDFDFPDFQIHVCRERDVEWLLSKNITHVFSADARPCPNCESPPARVPPACSPFNASGDARFADLRPNK